jgi:DNA-binding protein YbaB
MDDRRWGFEEADDSEYAALGGQPRQEPGRESEETLVGEDVDRVVQVVVSPEAEVIAVRLSPEWRRSVDPRALHTSVLSAANTATMRALAHNVEQVDLAAAAQPPREGANADESALTTQDVERLLDAVSAELGQFTERLSGIVDQSVHLRSAGGHVDGSAQRGRVLALDIDSVWAGQARHSEMETELLEVLRGLHDTSTPRELAGGPSGGAISELMELAADPHRLMRRLGMPDGSGAATGPTGEG